MSTELIITIYIIGFVASALWEVFWFLKDTRYVHIPKIGPAIPYEMWKIDMFITALFMSSFWPLIIPFRIVLYVLGKMMAA